MQTKESPHAKELRARAAIAQAEVERLIDEQYKRIIALGLATEAETKSGAITAHTMASYEKVDAEVLALGLKRRQAQYRFDQADALLRGLSNPPWTAKKKPLTIEEKVAAQVDATVAKIMMASVTRQA